MIDAPLSTIAQIHQLTHAWGNGDRLGPLDLTIPAGVTLLHGDEQTGKSTLLRLLSGELAPSNGWVDVQGIRADQLAETFAQKVFWCDPLTTALDQTSPTQWANTLPARYPLFNPHLWAELVSGFGLPPHMEKPLYMLSAGSRRKVWLSAAIASGAALTLIDQPFAALDGPSMRLLCEVLHDFSAQTDRACVIADYEAPAGILLSSSIAL